MRIHDIRAVLKAVLAKIEMLSGQMWKFDIRASAEYCMFKQPLKIY